MTTECSVEPALAIAQQVSGQLADEPCHTLLLAVDPGLLSGVALVGISERTGELVSLYDDELPFPEIVLTCRELLQAVPVAGLVVERFTITPQTGKNSQAGWSLEIIGCLKMLSYDTAVLLTQQSPASAKSFATNDKLKRLGLWHVGGEGHANDALRHAVVAHVKRAWTSQSLLGED